MIEALEMAKIAYTALDDKNVEDELHKAGCSVKQRAGNTGWVLLDFGDVIIHIFDKENRLFYDLERIWRDGTKVDLSKL